MPSTNKTQRATSTDIELGDRGAGTTSSSDTSQFGVSGPASTAPSRVNRYPFFRKQWDTFYTKLPAPVRRYGGKAVVWVKGPNPPEVNRIKPFLERIQTFPIRIFNRLSKIARFSVLSAVSIMWAIIFGVILSHYGLPSDIAGFGPPVRLSCTNRLWYSPQACGLDGRSCLPFSNASFAFSCPADCAGVQVLNPWTIGTQQIVYRSLVVGGTPDDQPIYRGDSFICGSAIHAGVVRDSKGGCGVVSLVGEHRDYGSIRRNGIESVSFNSSFPLSISFNTSPAINAAAAKCRDPRWDLLILSVLTTILLSLLTTSSLPFFLTTFTILFFQVSMASDPAPYTDYASLASSTLGTFLPALLIAPLLHHLYIHRTLTSLTASFEKTILWLGGAWVGALSNITLEAIPINRLTPHDIRQQPGALTALIILILVIAAIAIYQAVCFRREGRLPCYLLLYLCFGIGLGILAALPGLQLRIHHYILALLLIPGTSMQTRPSLLFQGLLLGLFVNGVARWGFAPVVQTAGALRGDARLGTGIPHIFPPTVLNDTHIAFRFNGTVPRGYEGVSVLVNDVKRVRGAEGEVVWERRERERDEYFRFGYMGQAPFGGVRYSDFSRAGRWRVDGGWVEMEEGVS
ncbi:hypothetical protein M011DRAFT_450097 [Sporormia fimetaria CBS 119925]|uniref:LCCL domain-containing protein n=1 Tax=Sporormia fimetaria CBS 119925 TaxID=1340428 RepID=A0A6A6V4B5_9PLEO|nr:hypothetical protein M011DRAFT_450097 [Sporormia fimetaria CBS 119925]